MNYKSWLYKNKIFPIIINKANCIINQLREKKNEIKLEILWKNQETFDINDCIWILNDGNNKPPMNKASGFQRFLIGLAMRITLSSLGVSKISNSQLFIDEGFTSFDQENLKYVPNFIEKLLLLYNGGILLVSHLDKISCNINNNLYINYDKNNKLSRLDIGQKNLYKLIN